MEQPRSVIGRPLNNFAGDGLWVCRSNSHWTAAFSCNDVCQTTLLAGSILDQLFSCDSNNLSVDVGQLRLAAYFWLAEHHHLAGIASAATAVCICPVAGGTKTIRVGAGGIMLPNHSPMVIAEQFGTLATLFPSRIDLGLGRAPGTDQRTWQALRRSPDSSQYFPQDVVELQALLGPRQENQAIHALHVLQIQCDSIYLSVLNDT